MRSMAKRNLIEQLDEAVDAIMAGASVYDPDCAADISDAADPRLAPLIRIAAVLRHVPREGFRAEHKSQLVTQPPEAALDGASAKGSINRNRRADEAGVAALGAHDLRAALDGLAGKAEQRLATMDGCAVGVTRFSTQTCPWERHPDSDELLHVLEGELEVTTLTDDGSIHTSVPAGSLFVCPRGL